MDENSFKKLLDEAIEPLRQDIKGLKVAQEEFRDVQEELRDVQENRLLPAVTELEITVKSYADSYKINKHNIERVDTRLTTVEDELNIEVPEDLKVPHFSEQSH